MLDMHYENKSESHSVMSDSLQHHGWYSPQNSPDQSSGVEKAMAPYSSTLTWKIPWAEEPGRLQSMESLRVRHDWATSLSLFTFMHWRRKWQPTPVFLPGESQGWGAWWAAIYGVAQSRTWLKQLSSSSSRVSLTSHFTNFIIPLSQISLLVWKISNSSYRYLNFVFH